MQVSEMRLEEPVYLDGDRLEEICQQLGYSGGETAICAAMEDLAALLHHAAKLWRAGDVDTLELAARQVAAVSDRIGMVGLSRVAGSVIELAGGDDAAALAATVARMWRLGERSLLAIWDREDLMI